MTKTLNLRDLPEDLVRRAKAYAALRGFTLKRFIIYAIEEALEKDIPPRSFVSAFMSETRKKSRRRRKK